MKPIEKWQERFTALLKEAEEELGDYITVKVASRPKAVYNDGYNLSRAYTVVESTIYEFELHTNNYVV